jgi:hypothetical protein
VIDVEVVGIDGTAVVSSSSNSSDSGFSLITQVACAFGGGCVELATI